MLGEGEGGGKKRGAALEEAEESAISRKETEVTLSRYKAQALPSGSLTPDPRPLLWPLMAAEPGAW